MHSINYAELAVTTNFSFLRGASQPGELVHAAALQGHDAIGIADRNTLAGVVRAYAALDDLPSEKKPKLLVGARLAFQDSTPDILVYPTDRAAYGRLCRLLSLGKLRAKKGECDLFIGDLDAFQEGQLFAVMPPRHPGRETADALSRVAGMAHDRLWLAAAMLHHGDDQRRLAKLKRLARTANVPLLAVNDVLYHDAKRRALQDVVTCIREHVTLDTAGRLLEANAERHLKPPREMARLFRDAPDAIAETIRFAERIQFSLGQLKYNYPDEPVPPGKTAQGHLEDITWEGAAQRYPHGVSAKVRATLEKELALIGKLQYAPYFLTVHDIVRYAKSREILCQGRGSAANSAVCFVLGITSVDPDQIDVLFERFISEERKEPPDIDVDFEHERREEVIQWIYERYGRHRAAIAATVICYRPRSAIRDVGKAFGLTEDVTAALAGNVWGSWGDSIDVPPPPAGEVSSDAKHRETEGAAPSTSSGRGKGSFDPNNATIARAVSFANQLMGFPRHLSQHVGGFVLTQDRLDETIPIGNAAMDDRTFIEWDKDDIDTLCIMKVDVLALGMLTCIRKALDLIAGHGGARYELATIPREDPAVYRMLSKGDSIGVFQVESRAQINMLPRLKPVEFYDLVIEVAIVRPGPIQGDMVHPYLRRRSGKEPVIFPSPSPEHGPADELVHVLGRTKGVPLFQEQAMKLAIVAAKFTADEANGLRRAMATFRNVGTIHTFRDRFIGNMVARGYEAEFAERCFKQIEGFGTYGFPESHAAAFAQLVYVSAWIKLHHPAAFAAALLNAQPMGFYAPAEIVRDAREHDVEVRAVDVSHSGWHNTLERRSDGTLALRLGIRQIDGFREEWAKGLATITFPPEPHPPLEGGSKPSLSDSEKKISGRGVAATSPLPEVCFRANARIQTSTLPQGEGEKIFDSLSRRLSKRALMLLAEADAFRSWGMDRREALWAVRRLSGDDELPLFAARNIRAEPEESLAPLPAMPLSEHVLADYQTVRLSLKGYPMQFLRRMFESERVMSCAEITAGRDGQKARCAGIVLVRQRPGEGKAIFITLSDETGICNVVLWARTFEQFRKDVMGSRLLLVEGRIQKSPEGVVHLMGEKLSDRTHELDRLSEDKVRPQLSRADGPTHGERPDDRPRHSHPRNVRVLPKSRDFH
ncbi:MAG: error-prone DNA polymerase [Rhizomicrobium sp.]|jgi:error-prone DNA polymerase